MRHHLVETFEKHPEAALLQENPAVKTATSEITAAAKSAGSAIAPAAEKGAKWFGGGKILGFRHTAETVGKDLEKISKIRTPKVLGAGALVLGGGYLVTKAFTAGTGNTGPGEQASKVAAREPQQAGMSV